MGEFAKWAAQQLEEEPEVQEEGERKEEPKPRPPLRDWRERASEQTERFRQRLPLSADIGAANAQRTLQELTSLLHGLGYRFRMQRHLEEPELTTSLLPGDPGIPGHDVSISLPKEASWLEPALLSKEAVGPLQAMLQDARVEARASGKKKRRRAFATGENPLTVPGFVPMAAIAAPESFREGFVQADTDASRARNEMLASELEAAKSEFEQALSEEYRGRKAASAGEWLDGLAEGVLSLEKKAESEQGEAMKWLNAYLGLAALLGYGSFRATKSWTEKRDKPRQAHKLYRMALRQRMHDKGVPVLVDYDELPAARENAGLTDQLPVQETKEAMWTFLRRVPRGFKPMTAEMAGYPHKRISGIVAAATGSAKGTPALSVEELERLKILAENARALQNWTWKARAGGILPPITTRVE